MRRNRINLNGSWIGTGTDEKKNQFQFIGQIPGCVHTDLIKNRIINYDIFWRDNHKKCLWIEESSFSYSREFILDEKLPNAQLVFEGLDTYCDIYVNGEHVANCQNMFIEHSFPVENALYVGKNLIEVKFRSPLFTRHLKARTGAFTTERLYTRRMQCTYGWDWVARFVTMGIFKDVYISYGAEVAVENVYLYTKEADNRSAQVVAETRLVNYTQGAILDILLYSPSGEIAYHNTRYCCEKSFKEYIDVIKPELWFPNDYGQQPLYRFCIKHDGCVIYESPVGIVTSRILCQRDLVGSEYYQTCLELKKTVGGEEYDHNEVFFGFELLVNGVGIMCKGANWVPCEPFPSAESREKITKVLELAKAAHVNMIRVWGGGIFEKDHFYNECDRLGIMVTQDFLMACGEYPEDDPAFLEDLRSEAKSAALRLRNHPCLMWWTGDNENAVKGSDAQKSFPGRTASLSAIGPVLDQYDPQRRFLVSSPWGGNMYASKTAGTTHNTQFLGDFLKDILDVKDYKEYLKEFTARFIAEEPSLGAAERRTLLRFMTEQDILDSEDMWLVHTKTNPVLEKELFEYSKIFAENIFGKFENGEDRLLKLQYLQYEWIRISMENARRNKGFCNGILYWMLNDCWPAASGWSVIDYYNYPKAAYYSFKRCAKPVVASIDRKTDRLYIYICNDSLTAHLVQLEISVLNPKTGSVHKLMAKEVDAAAAKSSVAASFPLCVLNQDEIMICELRGHDVQDRAFYKFGNLPIRRMDSVEIIEVHDNSIDIKAEQYTHVVRLEGDCEFSDNYFSMLPGEIRSVSCDGATKGIKVAGFSF